MSVEFELKYRAAPQILEQLRRELSGDWSVFEMATTYYDTPSGALSARFYTLRKRMENSESICTLKTPLEGLGRGEWEVPCTDIRQAIPLLIALGAPRELETLAGEGLVEVCGARFTRQAVRLPLGQGFGELALDHGILTGGGKTLPLCEAELELKEGAQEELLLFGQYFARRYGLTPEKRSKFRRALALYKGEDHV